MSIRKQLSHLVLLILGGLITISLSACGLNKDSREWIEKIGYRIFTRSTLLKILRICLRYSQMGLI